MMLHTSGLQTCRKRPDTVLLKHPQSSCEKTSPSPWNLDRSVQLGPRGNVSAQNWCLASFLPDNVSGCISGGSSDKHFPDDSPSTCVYIHQGSMMVSHAVHSGFHLWPLHTDISPELLNLFTLWTVADETPEVFAVLHWEVFWQFSRRSARTREPLCLQKAATAKSYQS